MEAELVDTTIQLLINNKNKDNQPITETLQRAPQHIMSAKRRRANSSPSRTSEHGSISDSISDAVSTFKNAVKRGRNAIERTVKKAKKVLKQRRVTSSDGELSTFIFAAQHVLPEW